ncbi:MAG: hypothetical protein ABIH21_05190 [Patescibacteria group bacterium]
MIKTVGVFCLDSAFGFLKGLDVSPYSGRGIALDYPLVLVNATNTIMDEHAYWRRHRLGAQEVRAFEDVYASASSAHQADKILRMQHEHHMPVQFFFVGDTEEAVAKELGVSGCVWGASAELTRQIASKANLHERAVELGIQHTVVPSRICVTPQEAEIAFSKLIRTNTTIAMPDMVVFKQSAWASGEGTEFVRSAEEAHAYAQKYSGSPMLAEAGYSDIIDASVQGVFSAHGIEAMYLNEQIILDGMHHAGNLVVSNDMVPSLTARDRQELKCKALPFFRSWQQDGYNGVLGLDSIGIRSRNSTNKVDWRCVDPNPRINASFYPWRVLRQVEERFGGSWAVLMCNLWPASGAVETFEDLIRILSSMDLSGDELMLPLMTGLLPHKFAVVIIARESSRTYELLNKLRYRVGSK